MLSDFVILHAVKSNYCLSETEKSKHLWEKILYVDEFKRNMR